VLVQVLVLEYERRVVLLRQVVAGRELQSLAWQHAVLAMQAPLHSLKLALHVKPQLPSQVASELAGTAQGLQSLPHNVVLSSGAHKPEQSCEPLGHTPVQAAFCAMQAPAHAF